eukprot:ctg_466.g239
MVDALRRNRQRPHQRSVRACALKDEHMHGHEEEQRIQRLSPTPSRAASSTPPSRICSRVRPQRAAPSVRLYGQVRGVAWTWLVSRTRRFVIPAAVAARRNRHLSAEPTLESTGERRDARRWSDAPSWIEDEERGSDRGRPERPLGSRCERRGYPLRDRSASLPSVPESRCLRENASLACLSPRPPRPFSPHIKTSLATSSRHGVCSYSRCPLTRNPQVRRWALWPWRFSPTPHKYGVRHAIPNTADRRAARLWWGARSAKRSLAWS